MPSRDLCELGDRRQLREADHPEVRLVHPQEQSRVGADRAFIVRGAGAVRRPHLDQARAGPCEHVGDPEAVADLDQLATRDDHFAPLGERGEREQHRGRVVVDDESRLRSGQPAQHACDVVLARAARAGLRVVLEVRVTAPHLANALERRLRQGCTSEIRVHDDAGRVQRAPQARFPCTLELGLEPLTEIPGVGSGLNLLARARENTTCGLDCERVVATARELVHRWQVAQLHWASAFSAAAGTSALRVS